MVEESKEWRLTSGGTSTLRPDITMWSPQEKLIILLERMVPWEEAANASNLPKTAGILGGLGLLAVVPGCRGPPAQWGRDLSTGVGPRAHLRMAAVGRRGRGSRKSLLLAKRGDAGGEGPARQLEGAGDHLVPSPPGPRLHPVETAGS